jgi:hypothetical protein
MADLATKGTAKFQGHTMQVTKDNTSDIDHKGHLEVHKLDSMFQAAAMDMANGGAHYDVGSDVTKGKDGKTVGLTVEQAKKLSEALLGAPMIDPGYLDKLVKDGGAKGQSRTDTIKAFVENHTAKAVADDHPGLFVALNNGHKGKAHMVLVTSVENGMVNYTDGYGKTHSMSEDKFASHVTTNDKVKVGEDGNLAQTAAPSAPVTAWSYSAPKTFSGWHA